MSTNYFRVRLSQVPAHLEDVLTGLCFDYKATGVAEALHFAQPDLTYEAKVIEANRHELDAFFETTPDEDFFAAVKKLHFEISWKIIEEEQKDWLEEWKKGFVAFKLVGNYWIVPSWLTAPEECKKAILIDPGMAFGTGTHPTTQMMAHFIHKLSETNKEQVKNWTMLDVGTGTAILAMLASFSGFGLIQGIEIDPEARRVARENIKLNKVDNVEIPESLIEEIRGQYDVVVANIIDGVLINIRSELLRVLKPGGHLLLTGILEERDNLFFEKFIEKSNLTVVRRLEKDEWIGYWVQSPTDGSAH